MSVNNILKAAVVVGVLLVVLVNSHEDINAVSNTLINRGVDVADASSIYTTDNVNNEQLLEEKDNSETSNEEEEIEPSRAVLFPWFTEILGVLIFFLTTRYVLILPYTGIMFILGIFMGCGATRLDLNDHLTQSLTQWSNINYEVLLLVFLPGLIFNDSFGLDVHLFGIAINQCIIYAFPMVLAGTALTALVGYYVLPYDWSFNLAMTFGSILSATDPVAVSSLLDEVGAPPRLKIHIGGESLLNDGSAMVFFSIFSALFLYEMGIAGIGREIDLAEGFALFFRMSLGGAAVGFAWSLALILLLYILNRRLTASDNVVQVCSTVIIAYLCYYTADAVCGTSGVIATLTCGVLTQAFGSSMINDTEMMSSFWSLVEQLLNTLLFTLGGLVFGGVISGARADYWTSEDWGYLFLLWVLLHIIRYFLVYAFYPLNKRIGLSTNWKECFFLAYGGLRGAVGISLALSLDNIVWSTTEDETYRKFTTQLFGLVGGTAFLTLVINGSTAGPLLQRLGLAKSTSTRHKILQIFRKDYLIKTIDILLSLLKDERLGNARIEKVLEHLDYTDDQGNHRDLTSRDVLNRYNETAEVKADDIESMLSSLRGNIDVSDELDDTHLSEHAMEETDTDAKILTELRATYIEQLKWAYQKQTNNGEFDGREAFLAYVINQGLDFSYDNISKGGPLDDWSTSQMLIRGNVKRLRRLGRQVYRLMSNAIIGILGMCFIDSKHIVGDKRANTNEFCDIRFTVKLSIAMIQAHKVSDKNFKAKFGEIYPAEANQVLHESKEQVALAQEALDKIDPDDVQVIIDHFLCIIIRNKQSQYLEGLLTSGLLTEKETQKQIDVIEASLNVLVNSST